MALFKILRGSSASLADKPIVDGYCYYTPDNGLFYIDHDGARTPLNAQDAATLAGASLKQVLNNNKLEIPSSALLHSIKKTLEEADSATSGALSAHTADKNNPHGVTAAQAGAAPKSHASSSTTYGAATTSNYGHVKISNGDADTVATASGLAAGMDHTHSKLAPKASPALTGTPTAPTAATGTNTTQIATTAFVTDAVNNLSESVSNILNNKADKDQLDFIVNFEVVDSDKVQADKTVLEMATAVADGRMIQGVLSDSLIIPLIGFVEDSKQLIFSMQANNISITITMDTEVPTNTEGVYETITLTPENEFTEHVAFSGNGSQKGHVILSDSTSDGANGINQGVAATPKAVKAAYDLANERKVKTVLGNTTKAYLMGTSSTPTASGVVTTAIADSGVYLDTTAGQLVASKFKGALVGNADSATKLTSSAGSESLPVYFSGGKPVQCSDTLGVNITGSSASCTGNAATASEFQTAQTVSLTGDVTGTKTSKAGWSIATTLKNSGVTAGSYGPSANATPGHGSSFNVPYFTVDAQGRLTAASTKTISLPTYAVATTSANGLMSSTDKSKLDGIASGANKYVHPTYTARTGKPTANLTPAFGESITISQITSDTTGHVTAATDRTITLPNLPTASGTQAGITLVYPAASCTTFSSDSGTVTPAAVQKGAKMFAITRPSSSTTNAVARYSNTTGDVKDSKITIEDVTNSKDSSLKANVLVIPAEGNKKMVYGYCTDQIDGTSFIGGVFDASATEYPYAQGLAIGGTSGNLLWKGVKVATTSDLVDTKNTAGSTNSSSKLYLIGATSQAANPQTYSHDTAYVGTDGCLYSGGAKVLTAHPSISTSQGISTETLGNGSTFTAIESLSTDSNGHVVSYDIGQYTLPRYSNFVKSGSGAKAGLVPAPSTTAGTTKYLREDGTWVKPPNTTYSNFVKSGTGAAAGLVPAPSTTAGTTKYLREDGTWQVPPNTNTDTKVTTAANTTTTKGYVTTCASATTGTLQYHTSVYVDHTKGVLFGAAWNDFAEYRISDCQEAGRVIYENGDDTLSIATERLQPGANVISDTFGFAIGETEAAKTPIAVSGRVLVYTYEDRNEFKPGDAVCAAPNGTVSKMTREEIREYPERIIGTVSAIPSYETWGEGKVAVNGRIWIKI